MEDLIAEFGACVGAFVAGGVTFHLRGLYRRYLKRYPPHPTDESRTSGSDAYQEHKANPPKVGGWKGYRG